MKASFATLELEQELWNKNYLVIGVDEVGRGALAGPVGVGAVCFDPARSGPLLEMGINDSKKLTADRREELTVEMRGSILSSSVMLSPVSLINSNGIVYAVNNAIRRAVSEIRGKLDTKLPFFLLLDAFFVKNIPGNDLSHQNAIIKGDEKSISIAAASIYAKVHRDAIMSELSSQFLPYQWNKNKGYGTKEHCEAIKRFGPTQHHRNLFIRNVLSAK